MGQTSQLGVLGAQDVDLLLELAPLLDKDSHPRSQLVDPIVKVDIAPLQVDALFFEIVPLVLVLLALRLGALKLGEQTPVDRRGTARLGRRPPEFRLPLLRLMSTAFAWQVTGSL